MSRPGRVVASYVAGVLCANSLPHLASAVSGHRHMTPVGGKESSHLVNLTWGGANLLAGLALIGSQRSSDHRWDVRLVAFDAGAATFATWMAVSERFMGVNWHRSRRGLDH